jgi:hypothetical protein
LRELEAERDTLLVEQRELTARREATASPVFRRRLADLEAACKAPEIDRTAVNTLLRQVISAVEVDPDARALSLHYKAGGRSEWVRWDESAAAYGFAQEP